MCVSSVHQASMNLDMEKELSPQTLFMQLVQILQYDSA